MWVGRRTERNLRKDGKKGRLCDTLLILDTDTIVDRRVGGLWDRMDGIGA